MGGWITGMARPLRIKFPGALYHVTSRGNGGVDIVFEQRGKGGVSGGGGEADETSEDGVSTN